jgi:tyrosine-protein kinase Etk/Wzc
MDSKHEETVISLQDLWSICKQAKYKIALSAACVALLGAFFTLSKPVLYEFEATFRERENKDAGLGGSFTDLLSSRSLDSRAASLMKSRVLMEQLVNKLALQAIVTEMKAGKGLFGRIVDNLKVDYAYFKRRATPLFADAQPVLSCVDVRYDGEIVLPYKIVFASEDAFELYDRDDEPCGEGRLDIPVQLSDCTFTIKKNDPSASLISEQFAVKVLPLDLVASGLAGSMQIEADGDDKNLLILNFMHPDRKL